MQDCFVGQAWTRYNYALYKHTTYVFRLQSYQTAYIAYAQHRNWVQNLKQTHVWQNMYCCTLIQYTMCSAGQMAIYTSRCYEQMKALLTYLLFSWPHHCSHCMEGLHEWLPPIDSIFSLASLYKVLKMCYIKFLNIWETCCQLFIPFVWRAAKKLEMPNF